ncbi:unnamed protein product, partial [Vitis vinifera]|uniref:Transcription factor MYB35 n=1 Tax=Vitis vinifera TaxID=29760 RepID=D7SIJ0_VITVI
MVRPPCCDKLNVKRGLWTAEEDAKILAHVSKHGTGNWTAVPKKAGLRRCGKSCRLRWTNYLRPDLKHESFTPQEEELIVRLHATIGSRWSIIAQQLPGRTDNDVKNYWNTKLRKKLSEMGIDPITHKPFSQILADYGNIGGLPKNGTRIGSLTRDLKNALIHDNPSMNLLTQLKAIKLVTEASSCIHHGNISSLSSPSSSSTCLTPKAKSLHTFSWSDFLLEDAFLSSDPQEQENMSKGNLDLQSEPNADGQRQVDPIEEMTNTVLSNGASEASSSYDSSFLEAMLDRENDMFLEFPSLLEEPFYY